MINIQKFNELYLKNNTIILGQFKTFHLGHQNLIKLAQEFDKTSILRIKKENEKYIFTNLELSYLIKKFSWNISNIFELEFEQIKNISALEFIEVLKKNNIENVVCGQDFRFGKNRSGDVLLLKKHFNVKISNLITHDLKKISTSDIISKMQNFDPKYFYKTHGFNYFVYNKVIHGDKIGRTINFPTINLDVNDKIIPEFGVYASNVIFKNRNYLGATYIGLRPSLNKTQLRFETNIIDFNKQIYEQKIFVELKYQVRKEIKINGIEMLKKQITKDVKNVKLWRNSNK